MERIPFDKSVSQEDKFLNALAEAYRLQEAIISATELVIVSTNTKGLITSFNNAAESLLGYSGEEVIGKFTPVIFHDLDEIIARSQELTEELGISIEPGFEALTSKTRVKKVADRNVWTYVKRDGTRFPVSISVSALWDDQGNLIGYAAIAADITLQKENSDKIKKSESHLRALISSIEDVVYEVDEDGRYVNIWTKNEEDLFLPRNEILGRTLSEMYGPKFAKPFEDILARTIETLEPQNFEYKVIKADERWFNAKFSPIYEKGLPTKRISVSVHDITDRKKIEFGLIESEQKFRLLADNIPGAIYLCNNDQHYSMLYLNDTILSITGYTKEEFLNGDVHFSQIYHPDDVEKIVSVVDNALEAKQSFHLTYRIIHKSHEIRWVEEYGIGVYDDSQLLFIEGFISDITQRKRGEQELIQSKKNLETLMIKMQEQNRQQDEFSHIISHNLRGPLGNITALISFINDKSTLDEFKLIFDKIKNVSANLNETMNELMDTLKIKKDTKIERTELRFKDILDKVVQSFEGNLIQCGASVTYDFKIPNVYFPKTYLESIFQNLLSNAIKYRSETRVLEIHFSTEGSSRGSTILKVSDNGLGIDLEKFGDKLFGMHKTFHDHKEARGVGLFLTKTQMETMGGTIQAESVVDKGTTFILTF